MASNGQQIFVRNFESLQDLKMTVDKLDDFCATYDLSLRLHGTEGTLPAEKVLKTLQPLKSNIEALTLAKNSGYEHQFKPPKSFQTKFLSENSMVLEWSLAEEQACLEGFQLTVYNAEDGSEHSKSYIDSPTTQFQLTYLRPCTNYVAHLVSYMGKSNQNEPIFLGDITELEVKTMPDMSTPFSLNIQAQIKTNSLTISIPKLDLDQCVSYQDLKFSICDRYLERGSCFLVKRGDQKGHVDSKSSYYRVHFPKLRPCRDYQVHKNKPLKEFSFNCFFMPFSAPD